VAKAVDGVSFWFKRRGNAGTGWRIRVWKEHDLPFNHEAGALSRRGRIVGGKIILTASDLLSKDEKEMGHIRGKRISMILQDPMTSLTPLFT